MLRWLLPWFVPLGLVAVVVVIATSALVGAVLAVIAGLVSLPFVYRAYQDNRAGRDDGGPKPRRPDPPNNRSLLR
jgi:hypothetical protein